ncbi:phytoene/squalene synthase family protein [Streptococcus pluranimalium]|uniref:phytoene/squalene synthase family protein n=1 Tax=Streptococcus pluranimalium TaxID=82348 RepID=UPI003F690015
MMINTLSVSYQVCSDIMKNHSKSFYQAFKNLPPDRFRGVTAIYAFCRFVDDLVDEKDESVLVNNYLTELKLLAETTNFRDSASEELIRLPWWSAFVDTVEKYQVSTKAIMDQLLGQESDQCFELFETFSDLELYCRRVAGSVGAMLWPMLAKESCLNDEKQADYLEICYQLGTALQLTNILRDVGEDLRQRQRIYLPKYLFIQEGVTFSDLSTLINEPQPIPEWFKNIWCHLSLVSNKYYELFEKNIHIFHKDCQVSLLSAARIYHAIEEEVISSGYDCLYQRHYTSHYKRLTILKQVNKELRSSIL